MKLDRVFQRRRLAAGVFLVLVTGGLIAGSRLSDAEWIALLWLSWIPLLVAVWPEVPATVPPIGQSALRMTVMFLTIMVIFSVQLLRVQVVLSDSFIHRSGVDPATGEVVSNRSLIDDALSIHRGTIFDRNGVALASTTFNEGVARRVYPEPAAAPVLGYYSPLLYGASGLEASWDDQLAGRSGGNPIVQSLNALRGLPPQGYDLHLTLDLELQQQAQTALGDRAGAVVLLDVRSGAVLALASSPTFDPNAIVVANEVDRAAAESAWSRLASDPLAPLLDRATSGLYPPGSTFKTVTAAAAVEAGIASPDTIYRDTGELEINGHTLPENNRPNPDQTEWTLKEALAWSLNVVFAQVGLQLGGERLADAARGWGWEAVIPFDLPVEPGRVSQSPDFLDDPLALAETAFGQGELQVTPLQMALVASGLANQGVEMRPYLVSSLTDTKGETVRTFEPSVWRRGTDPQAARVVAEMMVGAVEHGALGSAFVPGYTIGGKTGTAETGTGDPHAWFIGFVGNLEETPRFAVAVVLDHGGGGGQVALPIGRDLLVAAMTDLAN
jgi:peptidoglycan glycosyltransferase